MRIEGQRESDNVEDVRGSRFGRGAGIGCGGVLIALVIALITGQDPAQILQLVGLVQEVTQQTAPPPAPGGPPADALGKFASVVLASTEDPHAVLVRFVEDLEASPQLLARLRALAHDSPDPGQDRR